MVENLRPRIAEIAENLMDGMSNQQTGEGDLIQIFAFPLPVIVIAEMLGVPSTDRDKFREWTKNLLFGDSQETAMVSAMEFTGYINEMMEERKAHPQDDLLTSLIQAEEAGDKMNHQHDFSAIGSRSRDNCEPHRQWHTRIFAPSRPTRKTPRQPRPD
jgi:cytochrome P450